MRWRGCDPHPLGIDPDCVSAGTFAVKRYLSLCRVDGRRSPSITAVDRPSHGSGRSSPTTVVQVLPVPYVIGLANTRQRSMASRPIRSRSDSPTGLWLFHCRQASACPCETRRGGGEDNGNGTAGTRCQRGGRFATSVSSRNGKVSRDAWIRAKQHVLKPAVLDQDRGRGRTAAKRYRTKAEVAW